MGCREVKFFPAEPSGGVKYLKSISAPYAHLGVRFLPLGGITASVIEDYLTQPFVLALGGSWLAPRNTIKAKDWRTIEQNAAQAKAIVNRQ